MNRLIKKSAIICFVLLAGYSYTFAQAYQKGDGMLNIGVGIGGGLGTPIGLSYEHGFSEKISGGVFLGYAGLKEDLVVASYKWTYILGGARASYHFDFNVDKLDPYIGVILGYNYAKGSWENGGGNWPTPSAGGVVYGGHAGARYYLSEKFALFAEVGYGLGSLTAGLAFKL